MTLDECIEVKIAAKGSNGTLTLTCDVCGTVSELKFKYPDELIPNGPVRPHIKVFCDAHEMCIEVKH